ncbi:hypothetical protein [Flagellimonas onchidii]|uniref:hypothetical protein n=1 Tax=Flagellimonas onchidii TaxID=2562684 RepID=UPI0010A647D2|nr:hypothetical protein [Allomuricauda onchidii]
MKKLTSYLSILLLILATACNSSNGETSTDEIFDIKELLNVITTETILPTIEEFNARVKSFDGLVNIYILVIHLNLTYLTFETIGFR